MYRYIYEIQMMEYIYMYAIVYGPAFLPPPGHGHGSAIALSPPLFYPFVKGKIVSHWQFLPTLLFFWMSGR